MTKKIFLVLILYCVVISTAWKVNFKNKAVGAAFAASSLLSHSLPANAVNSFSGTIIAPITQSDSKSALYITVKQELTAVEIVGSAKKPALLTKRIPGTINFPYSYNIDFKNDATPEGTAALSKFEDSKSKLPGLVFAVRLDTDGVAATRDTTDLVGKGDAKPESNSYGSVDIALTDRGLGGKFVTTKKK